MRTSDEFRSTVRDGVRVGRPTLVVHARLVSPPSRVGFVVSKAVGNAVTRNRVKRRLRHLVAEQLRTTEASVSVVVRALPPAAGSQTLAADLAGAWTGSLKKLGGAA